MLPVALFLAASAADYAGSAACRECHPGEYAAQSGAGHARSLARSRRQQPGEWAFGAGVQAITFVSRAGSDHYLELEQSWYTRLNRYGRTPGHQQPGGVRYRIFDPEAAILRCFSCHSTGPVSLAEDGAIVPAELGVRCEACHGPAAAHAREPAKVRPLHPAGLDGVAMNDLCGTCHRAPSASVTADLRDPWNARHQPLLLAASACFRASRGRLKCTNCHAPHAALETRLAAYDASCGMCHRSPRHATATKGVACAACHMPAVTPAPGLTFANHRIGIYRPGDALAPVRDASSVR